MSAYTISRGTTKNTKKNTSSINLLYKISHAFHTYNMAS